MKIIRTLTTIAIFAFVSMAQDTSNRFDPKRMDTSCKPCDDFYQYVNGAWLKENPIPAAYSTWGTFDVLQEDNLKTLRRLLEAAALAKSASGSNEDIAGNFYAACIDEAKVEALGAAPLNPELQRIGQISEKKSLAVEVARLHDEDVHAMFRFEDGTDLKDSSLNQGWAEQVRLSLPNRDYYTRTDEKANQTRAAFSRHMQNMFGLLGDAPERAAGEAAAVLRIEAQLAEASMDPVELRDPKAMDNRRTPAQFRALAPEFPWTDYLEARGIPQTQDFNVAQVKFYEGLNRILAVTPLEDWKTYLRWRLIAASAPRLSSKFVNENFEFFGKTMRGQKELQPRWRRCVQATDQALGEALGQIYVAREFPPESKARMEKMIDNLAAAFAERIQTAEWMGPETRRQALTKLQAFTRKIGYPNKWKDYSSLRPSRETYYENWVRATALEVKREKDKINTPVDKTLWGMTPPTVNAYYDGSNNEIVFPAGILRPPFFDPKADDALNYGAIGGVIGHEMTHGFDDEGSQFDAVGNLKEWWTREDRNRFDSRASCVSDQFSSYKASDGTPMNGKLVLGESIADLGGMTIAFDAFKKSMEGKPRPANIDGFTPEQRFFIGWAVAWTANQTAESERQQVLSDPHPLNKYRANGPLSNFPEFARAFGCRAADAMVRTANRQCTVW